MQKSLLLRLSPLAAVLALAGCAHSGGPVVAAAPNALDTWERAIQVTPQADEIRLAAHPTGISRNQARALTEFHMRWMQAEGGEILISAPNESGYRVGTETRTFLIAQGAPADRVRLVGYDAGGAKDAPVIVGFKRYTVTTPVCGGWTSATGTFGNESMPSLGCAVNSNLAAQVANPEDLLAPRTMDPADPGRRAAVYDKYRKGETTSTAKDSQASGAVSQAIE